MLNLHKSEYQEQCDLFQWIRSKSLSKSGHWWKLKFAFATLNGVKLPIGLAAKAKRQGNTRGVPDVILPIRNSQFSGLFIEMKIKGNKQTKEQKEYQEFLIKEGFCCIVCYNATEAIYTIEAYFSLIK